MFKKILGIFSVLALLVIAAGIAFAYFYEDEVKSFAIQSLNKQLATEVDVKNVDFSVLKTFPMASLEFEEVIAMETWQKSNLDTLFRAKSIFLKFNLWDIYHKRYKVKELEIRDAKINFKVDEVGTENFNFWKEAEEENDRPKELSFSMEKVIASNVDFSFENKTNQFVSHLDLSEVFISGNFQKSVFSANVESDFFIKEFSKKGESILSAKEVEVNGDVEVNMENSSYQFKKTSVALDGIAVLLDGILEVKNETQLDVALSGKDVDLKKALALLNKKDVTFLSAYQFSGIADFNGTVKGSFNREADLHFNIEYAIKDAKLKKSEGQTELRNIQLRGSYSNGEKNNKSSSYINLKDFSAELGSGKVNGKLKLKNFERPHYSLEANLDLQLSEVSHFFDIENLQDLGGNIKVDVKSNGHLQQLDKISVDDWKNANSVGNIKFRNVSFHLNDRPQSFKNFSGSLKIVNNSLLAENLKAEISSSDFNLSGKFINLIGFLLDEKQALMIDAKLASEHLELNELLLSNNKEKDGEDYHFSISNRINFKLDAKIDHLVFKKFSFKNCQSNISVQNQILKAKNIHFESMEGSIDGKLIVDASQKDHLLLHSTSTSKNINIKQLFHDMDNFGQDVLTSENLEGIASADINFSSKWSPQLIMDKSSLVLEGNFLIKKGKLMNFEPLRKLSKYISLDELNDIRFSTLQNNIRIKDEWIYIPGFEIRSSAMDLNLEGTHSFDNKINYSVELIVDQLLGMKIKKPKKQNDSEFGYVEDDGLGRSKLFLKMSGDLDNPNISYDTQQLKEHWKEEIKSEKKEIKEILNDEFGIFQKDSGIEDEDTAIKKKKADPFQIEWGDDDGNEIDETEEKELEASRSKSKSGKKSGFSKFFDKIAEPNQDEYIQSSSE